jgi:translation initiation factor IF-2
MMMSDWREAIQERLEVHFDDDSDRIRIPVIVKADGDGTLAAVQEALDQISQQSKHNINIDVIRAGVGSIQANEVRLAAECGGTILCFNIKNEQTIVREAEEEGITVIGSKIIYSLLDEAKESFARYLPKIPVEVVHGKAEVKTTYDIDGVEHKVAGLQVLDGNLFKDKPKGKQLTAKAQFRILRNGKALVPDQSLRAFSLKHFKEEVDEIGRGKECGLALAGFSDYEKGDIIECFSIEMKSDSI